MGSFSFWISKGGLISEIFAPISSSNFPKWVPYPSPEHYAPKEKMLGSFGDWSFSHLQATNISIVFLLSQFLMDLNTTLKLKIGNGIAMNEIFCDCSTYLSIYYVLEKVFWEIVVEPNWLASRCCIYYLLKNPQVMN